MVHTDGWLGYEPLEKNHTSIAGLSAELPQAGLGIIAEGAPSDLVAQALAGTHQGAVSHEHQDYYLDEFVFRFNRRNSRSRGKLFYRLVQQAVGGNAVSRSSPTGTLSPVSPTTRCWGYLSQVDTTFTAFI